MRVLVVDDAPLIRERLTALLEVIPGVEVVATARNAPQAVELTKSLRPDLVTLDLHMRGGDGFEFLQRVRRIDDGPHVVVLTNFFDEQYRRRCLALGAVAFLDKSSQFDKLEGLIAGLRELPPDLRYEKPSEQGTGW